MSKRTLTSADMPYRIDEHGNHLCRVCGAVCPGRRTSYCSDACVEEYLIRTQSGYAAFQVGLRDQGVCAICGIDTIRLRARVKRLVGRMKAASMASRSRADDILRFLVRDGWPLGIMVPGMASWRRSYYLEKRVWYDVDHIVPVVRGGGGCGLGNLRTLCVPCHRRETARLARERAREKRGLPPRETAVQLTLGGEGADGDGA